MKRGSPHPAWLTGGEFGVEGSAVATVVLAALTIWSYRYYRKAEKRRVDGVFPAPQGGPVAVEA